MGIPTLNAEQILIFTLVFLRIGAMLVMIPVIGENAVPLRVKGGLAIFIALIVAPLVPANASSMPPGDENLMIAMAIAGEIMIGVTLGFAAKIVFAGIYFAGDLMGVQIGYAIVNIIDPVSRTQVSIISEFQYLVAALVYLTVDAHHMFIYAIADSYRIIAPFGFHFSDALVQDIIKYSSGLFVIAIKISAPVMAVLLFTNVALGVVARTVPQINIFIVGFPLQIVAGLFFLGLTIPVGVTLIQSALRGVNREIQILLRLM